MLLTIFTTSEGCPDVHAEIGTLTRKDGVHHCPIHANEEAQNRVFCTVGTSTDTTVACKHVQCGLDRYSATVGELRDGHIARH